MSSKVIELLNRVDPQKDESTHYSYFTPRGGFRLEKEDAQRFWLTYLEEIQGLIDGKHKRKLHLGEKIRDTIPIACNCELTFAYDETIEDYNVEQFIILLVNIYQHIIQENYEISDNEPELRCTVLKSESPEIGYNKQFHTDTETIRIKLIFPYCRVAVKKLKNVIPQAIKLLRTQKVRQIFPVEPLIESWEDILNPTDSTTAWPMYMSVTDSKENPMEYFLSYGTLSGNLLSIEDLEEFDDEDLILEIENIYYLNESSLVTQRIISPKLFNKYSPEQLLPIFLSNQYWIAITHLREKIRMGSSDSLKAAPTTQWSPSESEESTELEMAKIFIPMMGDHRIFERHYWLDVGRALYNITRGNNEGLELWTTFTERTKDQDSSKCSYLYLQFKDNNSITVKTLAWYARQDDRPRYDEWHQDWINKGMEDASDLTHGSVAKVVYRMFWLHVASSSVKNRTWYIWKEESGNHFWIPMDDASELRTLLTTKFYKRVKDYHRAKTEEYNHESNSKNEKFLEEDLKRLLKLMSKLRTQYFKVALVKECIDLFKDPMFALYENKHPELKAYLNGVIEVTDTQAIFREGKPQDYNTRYAQINYDPSLTWESPVVKRFMDWMNKVFGDEGLLIYFLMICASCFYSRNNEKIFVILSGEKGNNGKSMIKILLQNMFGSYFADVPVTALTRKRPGSSNPEPELEQAYGGSCIAWTDEPETDEPMRMGIVKSLTGGDSRFLRGLNKSGGSMIQTFTLFLQCNGIPPIIGADQAIMNRILVIPFLSLWLSNAPRDETEQHKQRTYPIDYKFDRKIPELAVGGLWVLVQMFSRYKKEGLQKPQSVLDYTRKYWEENDIYHIFIKENIEEAADENDQKVPDRSLTLTEIYDEFKEWFRYSYPSQKVPDKKTVRYELEKKWGRISSKGWNGIQLISKQVDLNGLISAK